MSISDVAKVATVIALEAISERESNHWRQSRFITPGAVGDGAIEEFVKRHTRHHNIDEAMINRAAVRHSAEREISLYVSRKLEEWWPTLTHHLWAIDVKRDTDKKLESELADLFNSKAIVKANKSLADAMETDADETLLPIIQKTVRRELAKNASANKKASRKKSSGDPKNQESTPGKSGHSNRANSSSSSKKQLPKSCQKSNTKSDNKDNSAANDNDDKSTASNENKKRGRSKSRPRSILKKPKVTFQRGRSPSNRKDRSNKSKSAANRDGSNSGENTNE